MENSATQLVAAIEELLDVRESRERMGQIGLERLNRELNWEKSSGNLGAVYDRLSD
jgi:glycosyltransferase involved in cell wall biosynthesis